MSKLPLLSPLPSDVFSSRFTDPLRRSVDETVLRYNEALEVMEKAPVDQKLVYATIAAGHLNVLAHIMSK